MIALFGLYAFAIVASCVGAATLSILGAHLASRGRAFATVATAQAITVGLLLGFLVTCAAGHRPDESLTIPLTGGLLIALLAYVATETAARRRPASRDVTFVAGYALLLAFASAIPALFPQLETHWTQLFVGDVATMSNGTASLALVVLGALGVFLAVRRRSLAAETLDVALYGTARAQREWRFAAVALVGLCLALLSFGFLFTLTALFVPTACLARTPGGGYGTHALRCALVSACGALAGFTVSLTQTHLPTAPTMALGILVAGIATSLVLGTLHRRPASSSRP